jgi:hypothetical protein
MADGISRFLMGKIAMNQNPGQPIDDRVDSFCPSEGIRNDAMTRNNHLQNIDNFPDTDR